MVDPEFSTGVPTYCPATFSPKNAWNKDFGSRGSVRPQHSHLGSASIKYILRFYGEHNTAGCQEVRRYRTRAESEESILRRWLSRQARRSTMTLKPRADLQTSGLKRTDVLQFFLNSQHNAISSRALNMWLHYKTNFIPNWYNSFTDTDRTLDPPLLSSTFNYRSLGSVGYN